MCLGCNAAQVSAVACREAEEEVRKVGEGVCAVVAEADAKPAEVEDERQADAANLAPVCVQGGSIGKIKAEVGHTPDSPMR